MRNAFIEELVAQAEVNQKIALVVGDLGYSVVEPFAEKFPNRFINAGVAEQNMMGLSAGLASEGYHVFVYSIANFPTFRCAEQIRNDVAYHDLPVTIVSVGGGVAYGNLGYSHHAVQDYSLMRAMPKMTILAPGDPMEVKSCLRYICRNPGPSYLRLSKSGEISLNPTIPKIEPGIWNSISKGNGSRGKTVILTTGHGLQIVHEWRNIGKMLDCDLCTLPIWGMNFKKKQAEQIENYSLIYSLEDHLIDGGFSSWLLESIIDRPELMIRLRPISLSADVCGMVGSQKNLHKAGGLGFPSELEC